MNNCHKCGVSGTERRLSAVISEEGVIKLCENCMIQEDMPVLKRPTTFQLKEAERGGSVYERLSKIAGVDAGTHRQRFGFEAQRKKDELQKQDINLRTIVDRNLKKKVGERLEKTPRADLIPNFHWAIMTARRKRKLTQAELGRQIDESEGVIRLAEQGIMPEDDFRLIRKLESYLGIHLVASEVRKLLDEMPKEISFDKFSTRNLTVADIKRMKEEQEAKETLAEIKEEENLNKGFGAKLKNFFSRKKSKTSVEEDKIETDETEEESSNEDMDEIAWKK